MRKWLWKLKQSFKHQALVLMYHRIASPETDPWQLAVSPENFEQHLQLLSGMGVATSANALMEKLEKGKLPKKSVVLTFDDGYADNFTVARPLLQKWNIPATVFVTTENIGRTEEFWWDELEQIIIHTPQLPLELRLPVHDAPFYFYLGEESRLTEALQQKHRQWVAAENSPSLRTQLYLKLWEQLSPLSAAAQQQALTALRNWANLEKQARPAYCCMNEQQLKELAATAGITIGGHTITHPALSHFSPEQQYAEIQGGKQMLEQITGGPITLFAYPSGNYNENSIEALKKAGFEAAFTTEHAAVTKKTKPMEVSRVQVNNWTGAQLSQYLSYWFNH